MDLLEQCYGGHLYTAEGECLIYMTLRLVWKADLIAESGLASAIDVLRRRRTWKWSIHLMRGVEQASKASG